MPLVINGFDLKDFDKEFPNKIKEQKTTETCFVCDALNNIYFQMAIVSALTICYILLFKSSKVKK